MNKAEKNLMVLENFILYITGTSCKGDTRYHEEQTYTAEELYRLAYDYIEDDWADGKGNIENL